MRVLSEVAPQKICRELIAHIIYEPEFREEPLRDHLELTAKFASRFGAVFNAGTLAGMVATAHDFGKGSEAFQKYIRNSAGDCEEREVDSPDNKKRKRGPDHSSAGAQFLAEAFPGVGHLLAYAAAGHHAGLPDGLSAFASSLSARLKKDVPEWEIALRNHLGDTWADFDRDGMISEVRPFLEDGYSCAFLARMLFSCLVDADFLATEAFMDQSRTTIRSSGMASLAELEDRLKRHYDQLTAEVAEKGLADSPVNQIRNEVKEDCLQAANKQPGLFTLTVPTGGGKTLASMAFALRHAIEHGLLRVVYVIPYTSIIEQTADTFRNVFGEENVLEHHSNVDFGEGNSRLKLLSENWDAPIVVTTSVQFFESLHANRTSRCRKVHNLARAVIVLDEAQTIPIDLLRPCLRVLDELVVRYGSSVVLCTATQPAVSREKMAADGLAGNAWGCREIIAPNRKLYQRLKRVKVERIPGKISEDALIEYAAPFDSVLIVVSTRKHARSLYAKMAKRFPEEELFHLSAQMCPAHRKECFDKIRAFLKDGIPCRVVSTQLIEAGVDVDFPCVFRQQAGSDAVAQAAGRCNREGRLPGLGHVFVFESSEHAAPRGFLGVAAQIGHEIMSLPQYANDLLGPEGITHYFESLYNNQKEEMDKFEVLSRLIPKRRPQEEDDFFTFKLRTLGKVFKMIDDHSVTVFVPYGEEGEQLCEALRETYATGEQRAIARKLQRYAVSIYGYEPRDKMGNLIAEHVHDTFWVLTAPKVHYSKAFGLTFEGMSSYLET